MNEYFFPCNLFVFNISRVDLQNLLLVCFTWTIVNCNLQICEKEVYFKWVYQECDAHYPKEV